MSETLKNCFPNCEFFRCGQRALTFQGRSVYCRWADDACTGGTCNYALCMKARLLPSGACGLNVTRKTPEEAGPEILEEPKVKLKGKILRRFKEEDIF